MPKLPSWLCGLLLLCGATAFMCPKAQGSDVFDTDGAIPSLAQPMMGEIGCPADRPDHPLDLQEVVERAMSVNPRVRQPWAEAKAQAAVLGQRIAAYLPIVSGSVAIGRDVTSTTYTYSGIGDLNTYETSTQQNEALNLAWIIFDFGKRKADIDNAKELLTAAVATQTTALQEVYVEAARAYYDVRAALAAMDAAKNAEATSEESLRIVVGRHEAGAATLGDQLQAQTAHYKAVIEVTAAQGNLSAAQGRLAYAIGLDANCALVIGEDGEFEPINAVASEGIENLIRDAKRLHPRIVAAKARLEAAKAQLDSVRALAKPTVSVVGSLNRNTPLGHRQGGAFYSRGATIGIQLNIPLFEGFASSYRIREAEGQLEAEKSKLEEAELALSLEIWSNYQELKTNAENVENADRLSTNAERALIIARGSYKAGVGTLLELLNAQTELAQARRVRIQAVSTFRLARISLAASLGRLGLVGWRG